MFELHTTLSERHRQMLDAFAQEKEYGNRRRVLERALELLETLDGVDAKEMLEAYKTRRSFLELFNFVLVNRELVEGLAKVALGKTTMATLFEKIREFTIAESKVAREVVARSRVNSFQDMAESVAFYSKHLNIIGEVHANEGQRQVFAKVNTFKSIPEIPLEILNTLLEASGYTFDLRLEDENNPIFIITWIPPDIYPEVREQKENYLNSRRETIIARAEKK